MSFYPWKHHFYAFLLRRALGPILTTQSAAEIRSSIQNVDWSEGTFEFVNVELDAAYLTGLIVKSSIDGSEGNKTSPLNNVAIQKAKIRRFAVHLSMCQNSTTSGELLASASSARKATTALLRSMFGSFDETSSGISLAVHVDLDGVDIEFCPTRKHVDISSNNNVSSSPGASAEQDEIAPGYWSSLLDSAMKSLRLSIDVNDVNVRLTSQEHWIALRLASARYFDLIDTNTSNIVEGTTSNVRDAGTLVVSKTIDWSGLVVETFHLQAASCTLLRTHGDGHVKFRFYEVQDSAAQNMRGRREVDVSLGQHVAVELDMHVLEQLLTIFNAVSSTNTPEQQEYQPDETDFVDTTDNSKPKFGLADEFTREAYDEVMKQYTEARHLARTSELRGGVLIPSFDDRDADDDGEISFDAFFDANDHSVSYYYDLIEDSCASGSGSQSGKQHVHEMSTKIDFGLPELTLKLNRESEAIPTANGSAPEYILVSLGDFQFVSFESTDEKKINSSISHFEIESELLVGSFISNEIMLRFVEHPEDDDTAVSLISSSPCISAYVELSKIGHEEKAFRLDLALQPIAIIYRHETTSYLSDFSTVVSDLTRQKPQEVSMREKIALQLSVSCPSLVVMMPCTNDVETTSLFTRCGYNNVEEHFNPFIGLGVEFDNVSADISSKTDDDVRVLAKSRNAILFAKKIEIEPAKTSRRRFTSSFSSCRTDLMACVGDHDGSSDSFIVISCTQKNRDMDELRSRKKSNFPMILPLSSMKVREGDDNSDADDFFDDVMQSPGSQNAHATAYRATDPQYIMSSEANDAKSELVVEIPCVFFDITLNERHELTGILSDIIGKDKAPEVSTIQIGGERKWASILINVGQLSTILCDDETAYSLVLDKMHLYTLLDGSSGLRNVRISSADFTLYEMCGKDGRCDYRQEEVVLISCESKCKQVHDRMLLNKRFSHSRAIFFRSKLSQPLSLEHPAILLDVILRKSVPENDSDSSADQLNERSVHLHIYDMTYRYYVGCEWLPNLGNFIKSSNTEHEEEEGSIEESLTSLFVNITDCNVDYTTPLTYMTASRSVLRIGDIQASSTLFSTIRRNAPQACKISLSEIGLYVCNYRHAYNEEDALLSSAHRHFSKESILVRDKDRRLTTKTTVNIVSTLSCMDFINVLDVDSIEAAILMSRSDHIDQSRADPEKIVALTIGTVHCNFCKDSFSCLTNTFNEWFIRFTALSDEELEMLRSNPEQVHSTVNGTNIPLCSDTSTSSSPSKEPQTTDNGFGNMFREEASSVDLTETLLFQDFYTINARNSSNIGREYTEMHQPTRTVQESPSSDDEWAAVEHEYLRNSSIPREDEQCAEWVMCDEDDGASAKRQTKPIKIFPQHFQSKPGIDPLGESHNERARLAASDVHSKVGVRFMVKDASISCHFFDGFDWETKLPPLPKMISDDRRKVLLSSLLDGEVQCPNSTLAPLPDERNEMLKLDTAQKRLRRNVQRYFSVTINGLKLNQDSYANSTKHRLASCLKLSISDFFVAETISSMAPVKMIGEWINEDEHPRDDSDGMIMLSMVTHHPALRVSADGKLMSDESKVTLELLPLRAFFHQTAIRFIRSFFGGEETTESCSDDEGDRNSNDQQDELEIIPVFFTSFKVKPAKLKVDYNPEKMDIDSFRGGNYVEILNLCPLEDMVLILQEVVNHDLTGWGSAFGELASRWIEDVGKTQSHKFFTRATPVQFISGITEGAADLAMVLVVPESGSFADYLKDVLYSSTSFASKLACETLTTSAKLTRYAANQLNTKDLLPRPKAVPRHVGDAAGHSVESISRGLRQANYTIVTVPYREYMQSGSIGAARSAVKGLPIAVLAPLSGASEALSYTLLGLRNSLRPDLRKEAEASLRGLRFE